VFAARYDERFLPAANKRGVVLGMAMTEKQGGSDVRSNSTTAKRLDGDTFELTGHKWFCSAPMCDAFLTLAQAAGGLTCFLVPRFRPDGTRNPLYVQRLKDKLGNRSNASSEIEYADTWAQRIGEEGRGVRTIIQMVHHTRLDCAMGSAGAMRMAVRQAVHHCSHREAFGKLLTAQPLMQNVLADIALEAEAATMLVMRLARAFDDSGRDASAKSFARVVTPVAKYWVCKRAPTQIAEALECLGGAGYVEESIMPRLYRDAPVNSIWEGSGNVQCLDVLRALHTHPDSLDALVDELGATRRADRRLDAAVAQLQQDLRATSELEARARRVVEKMALTLQASLLLQHAPSPVADAFCASRLDAHWGNEYGTLPSSTDFDAIISRARP